MKNASKIFPFVIAVLCLTLGIGYASINNITLDIFGSASSLDMDGIYITEVNYKKSSYVSKDESFISNTHQTMMNSTIVLSEDKNSSISYDITVYNSSNISFSYIKTVYDEDFYDNKDIVFELSNIDESTVVASKSYYTFTITFKYSSNVVPSNKTLNSYLNFIFLHPIKYIESTGTQYIDTKVKPNNDTTLDMEFSNNDIHLTQSIYGTRTQMDNGIYHNLFLYKNKEDKVELRWDENDTQIFSSNIYYDEGKKIRFIKDTDEITFITNGITNTLPSPHIEWDIDSTAYIFSQNQQSSPETRHADMKLYSLKMYDKKVLIRDFVPVLDKYEEPCLYDLVTNEYYYNIGTGRFIYDETFEVLDYLESSGTQYIDLGINPGSYTKAEFVLAFNELYSDTQSIFGARVGQVNNTYNMFWYQQALRWDYYNTITYPTKNYDITKSTFISTEASQIEVNNTKTLNDCDADFTTNYSIYLYAVNNANSAVFLNNGMKLYYFKLYQNDEVILNLIPVKDKNGVACFYDLISKTYFYNRGTGNFIEGN